MKKEDIIFYIIAGFIVIGLWFVGTSINLWLLGVTWEEFFAGFWYYMFLFN